MPLGNPFDFGPNDQTTEGLGGQSVGFWRDLAALGGNIVAAANQRTASGHLANGADFAGGFGVGLNNTMLQGRENALARAKLGLAQGQMQRQNLENQYYVPLTQAGLDQTRTQTAGMQQQQQFTQQFQGAPAPASANNYAQTVLGNQPAAPQHMQWQQGGGVNALAQQMQANRQLQRQIGYGGAPMQQPGQQPPVNIAGQHFDTNGNPVPMQPQAAAPGQPVGAATAAPQPMPGMAMQPMQQQRGMGQWGGGLGTGAANTLARYYQR